MRAKGWLTLVAWLTVGLTGGCQANLTASPRGPRFSDVASLVRSRGLRSVSELLPFLPPAYRANYVLVFESRSVQAASFEAPRVLLFGEDSPLVMSFNGSPDERGFDALETMEFDDETKAFRFREIRFPGAASGDAEISEITPSRCKACHGTPARPVWDTFPLWPGVYGERADAPLSKTERRGLEAFARNRGNHPRYQYLSRRHGGRLESELGHYEGRAHESNNTRFDSLLTRWNQEAIFADVVRSSKFSRYRYELLEALLPECQGGATVTPAYAQFALDSNRVNQTQESLKRLRAHAPLVTSEWPLGRVGHVVPLNQFRFLVETRLGLSTDEWSNALERATYDFAAPKNRLAELLVAAANDSSLSRAYEQVRAGAQTCNELRSGHGSLSSHADESALATNWHASPNPPAVLADCVRCHETEQVGPRLLLRSAADFQRTSASNRYPAGSLLDEILFRLRPEAGSRRMPLDSDPSNDELAALAAYFRAIAGVRGVRP